MQNNFFCNYPYINIFENPSNNSKISSQIIYGEKFRVLGKVKNFLKIRTSYDKYQGFIKNKKFESQPWNYKKACHINWCRDFYNKNYCAPIFNLCLINHNQIKDGITITVVKTKNVPQSPFSQSTNAPEDEASVVLPAVPIEASNAYCVAV